MPAASVLPVALVGVELYFLFGKETQIDKKQQGFSDFGGHREEKDINFFETAIRECAEELMGFLGDEKELKRKFKQQKTGGLKLDNIENDYHIYFLPVEYDEKLPEYFNSNMAFLKNNGVSGKEGLFEKHEIRWFHVSKILSNLKLFRPFYRNIIREIFDMREQIHNIAVFTKLEQKNITRKDNNRYSHSSIKSIHSKTEFIDIPRVVKTIGG